MALHAEISPARSYDDALDRARKYMARDGADILPQSRTALLDHGGRQMLAVVLFHGFTNNPAQYAELAPLLYKRGANVFVPRLPKHGEKDRLTNRIARLTAEMLLASATEAVNLASGLGDRVAVLGISMGGSLAAYFGQFHEIALAVPVAPEYALLKLPYPVSRAAAAVMQWLPDFFVWWDPRVREEQLPLTAYPRYSTRALAQTLRIGEEVYGAAAQRGPRADRIVTVVNPADPAVNNTAAKRVSGEWSQRHDAIGYIELQGLPRNHDIIEPRNPQAHTEIVYPKLLEIVTSG